MQRTAFVTCLHLDSKGPKDFNNAMLTLFQQNGGQDGYRWHDGNPVGSRPFRYIVAALWDRKVLFHKDGRWGFKKDSKITVTFDRLVLADMKVRIPCLRLSVDDVIFARVRKWRVVTHHTCEAHCNVKYFCHY